MRRSYAVSWVGRSKLRSERTGAETPLVFSLTQLSRSWLSSAAVNALVWYIPVCRCLRAAATRVLLTPRAEGRRLARSVSEHAALSCLRPPGHLSRPLFACERVRTGAWLRRGSRAGRPMRRARGSWWTRARPAPDRRTSVVAPLLPHPPRVRWLRRAVLYVDEPRSCVPVRGQP